MSRPRTAWLAALTVAAVLLVPAVCLGDDCARDPLNAADCMRSDGYRQFIVIVISILGTIGSIIASIVGATPATPATEPGQAPPDVPVGDIPDADLGGPADNPNTTFDEPPGDCRIGLPTWRVNTATLNLVILDTFFRYEGIGPAIELELVYNALAREAGLFGYGWHCSYDWRVMMRGNQLLVRKGSGQTLPYRLDGLPGPQGPASATPLGPQAERLFDHGPFLLLHDPAARTTYRFDKVSQASAVLTAITDRNECATTLVWNPDGTLAAIQDAAGRSTRFVYDASRLCTSFTTPDGRTAHLGYESGRLTRTTDLAGIPVVYQYDGHGLLVRMVVGNDRATTTFGYQAGPRGPAVASVAGPTGDTTRYEWIQGAQGAVRAVDSRGRATVYESVEGLTHRITNPAGATLSFAYDHGRRVGVQTADGAQFRLEYDPRGRLTRVVDPEGGTSTRAYDDWDRLVAITDATGYTSRFDYDARSNVAGVETSDGRSTRYERDRTGRVTAWTDPNGARFSIARDRFGNAVSVTDPVGATVRLDWGEHGIGLRAITDPMGGTTRLERDGNGRVTRIAYADGTSRTMTYACNAGLTDTDEQGRTTRFERDAASMVRRLVLTDGTITEVSYDGAGRMLELHDALRRTTTFTYDDAGHLVAQRDAKGAEVRLTRSRDGHLICVTDARGGRTSYQRDRLGRLTQVTDGTGASVRFRYDPVGRIIGRENARGQRVELRRGPDGCVVGITHDGAQVASLSYDVCGRLARVQGAAGATALRWDVAGRATSVAYPNGLELRIEYDASSRPRTMTYPGGLTVQYAYDARGRTARLAWEGHWVDLAYFPAGSVRSESRSNGTRTEFAYDAMDRPTSIRHASAGGSIADLHVSYDQVGNVAAVRGDSPVPPGPGRVQGRFSHDTRQAVVQRDGTSLEHDADGNLVGDPSRRWRARYDALDRLVEVDREGRVRRFAYDALSRRARAESESGVRQFFYDPWGRPVVEADGAGSVIACYVYREGQLVARVAAGHTWFYHFDALGSTLALTDDAGSVVDGYAYSPFGQVVGRLGNLDNPFTYVGAYGVFDDGDGLYLMGRRHYDASLGRFLQKDPIGLNAGPNPYAYAGNNPATRVDPSGLDFSTWVELVVGGASAYMILSPDPIAKTLLVGTATVQAVGYVGATLVGTYVIYSNVNDIRNPNTAAGEEGFLKKHEANELLIKDPDGRYRFNPDPTVPSDIPDYEMSKIREAVDKHNARQPPACTPPPPKKKWFGIF